MTVSSEVGLAGLAGGFDCLAGVGASACLAVVVDFLRRERERFFLAGAGASGVAGLAVGCGCLASGDGGISVDGWAAGASGFSAMAGAMVVVAAACLAAAEAGGLTLLGGAIRLVISPSISSRARL